MDTSTSTVDSYDDMNISKDDANTDFEEGELLGNSASNLVMDTSTNEVNEELEDGELVDEESDFPKWTSTLRDFIDDMEMDDPRDEEESDSPKLTSTTHDCSIKCYGSRESD